MKKIISVILSVVFITTCISFISIDVSALDMDSIIITDNEVIFGDVNGDGLVTSNDLLMLLDYLASYNGTTDKYELRVYAGADVNEDGNITSNDLFALLDYFASYDPVKNEYTKKLGKKEIILPIYIF